MAPTRGQKRTFLVLRHLVVYHLRSICCPPLSWYAKPTQCRLHYVHSLLHSSTIFQSRDAYETLRASYNAVHSVGSPPAPPFEEWRGIYDICDHACCRYSGFFQHVLTYEAPSCLPNKCLLCVPVSLRRAPLFREILHIVRIPLCTQRSF